MIQLLLELCRAASENVGIQSHSLRQLPIQSFSALKIGSIKGGAFEDRLYYPCT
jgi:hypothetical protein